MSGETEILFEERGPIGLVTLNRPKALNALTLEMCRRFEARLAAWAEAPDIRAVLVKGEGERAFCAGGDIRAIWDLARGDGRLAARFFRAEYRLDRRVFTFPKPYIALIDGMTMGGGVGISVHGRYRVASERTLFAMPETGIGFFPDVGGTYFLPRLPGGLGLYLGLTGARLKAADCLHATVATHYVDSARLDELEAALVAADWAAGAEAAVAAALDRTAGDPGPPPLAEHRARIDRCFAGDSVEAIVAALAAEDDRAPAPWAARTREALATRSPTSLKVTFKQLREGAGLDFDAAMTVEFRLSQACLAGHDFLEGIRAVVIDKDNAPRWDPPSLSQVTPELVAAHFAPLGARDLDFA